MHIEDCIQLKNVMRLIKDDKYEYISFDFFDTLVTRPFYRPEDLYFLLDNEYEKFSKANISFHKIRIDGENAIRKQHNLEGSIYRDVTQKEIYQYISEIYRIEEGIAKKICDFENELEVRYSRERECGKYLYDYALKCGKKLILISDTVLSADTIFKILRKHGYNNFSKLFLSSEKGYLKSKGDLFDVVLKEINVSPDRILHIGDNWKSDICQAKKRNIRVFHLPKSTDAFENRNGNFSNQDCSMTARKICGGFVDYQRVQESAGYGAMTAIVAQKFFDNPFTVFKEQTSFDKNPYFIGYYVVGMHILGIASWIRRCIKNQKYNKIFFTSRDGYLPMMAYNALRECDKDMPEGVYFYVSRKAMLPLMLVEPTDFFDLPVDYKKYSPQNVIELLDWCIRDPQNALLEIENDEVNGDGKRFNSVFEFNEFIHFFLNQWYDQDKHLKKREVIKEYLSVLEPTDILFDMGYSGRIQGAICKGLGRQIDALYIHSDVERNHIQKRRNHFNIDEFYGFIPCMSDVLREYLLSENAPSCIGYQVEHNKVTPEFDKCANIEDIVLEKIQQGAMEFVKDYCSIFKEHFDYVNFKEFEVSLPFEGFLRYIGAGDVEIFQNAVFEDEVFGAQREMSIEGLVKNRLYLFNKKYFKSDEDKKKAIRVLMQKLGKNVVLWGAGSVSEQIIQLYTDFPIDRLISENKGIQGKRKWGIQVESPDWLMERENLFIVIATRNNEYALEWLSTHGYKEDIDYVRFDHMFLV